ncbi:DNA-protecting protein DprA [Candidatus Microgenomates bacterium]|nr:DNA-protecting protein DprA [Candidatus Microgenomates bacterium]
MLLAVTISDSNYPVVLKEIFDPPKVLYVNGQLPKGRMVAVVGTRKMTVAGREVTTRLAKGLVEAGFVIVSGMALGVDGAAHEAAIEAGGKTVAVLGAGVELVYPREHRALYNSILAHGAIVSEWPGTTRVSRAMFPARNRIISGLCEAVVVTEGALDSGSLITARLALEQGRDVFAVAGSPGADYLIDQGATPVTDVGKILDDLRGAHGNDLG